VGEGDLLDSLAYEVVTQLGPIGIFDCSSEPEGAAAAPADAGAAAAPLNATGAARELLSKPIFVRQLLESIAGALQGDEARSGARIRM
jgi:hypothetical protein